jgi:hypothetical protein
MRAVVPEVVTLLVVILHQLLLAVEVPEVVHILLVPE